MHRQRHPGVRWHPYADDCFATTLTRQRNHLGGLACVAFCDQEIQTGIQMAIPEGPNQRAPQLMQWNSGESVAQGLAADLFEFPASFQMERKPIECAENVEDQPWRLRNRKTVGQI